MVYRVSYPNDIVRDKILRHLYDVHSTARGRKAVALGIKRARKISSRFSDNVSFLEKIEICSREDWHNCVTDNNSREDSDRSSAIMISSILARALHVYYNVITNSATEHQ